MKNTNSLLIFLLVVSWIYIGYLQYIFLGSINTENSQSNREVRMILNGEELNPAQIEEIMTDNLGDLNIIRRIERTSE
jgi:hypothetical protein